MISNCMKFINWKYIKIMTEFENRMIIPIQKEEVKFFILFRKLFMFLFVIWFFLKLNDA